MRKRILVDLDNVLADFGQRLCEVVSECEGESVSSSDVKCWDIHKYFKCGTKVYNYLTYDLFRTLPVIEGSQEALKELSKDFDVFIVSSATNIHDSLKAKMEWLNEHFPFIHHRNIVLCGDKSVVQGDYLIDDAPHNLEVTGDIKILFDSHHNQDETRFTRAMNWEEVVSIIRTREKNEEIGSRLYTDLAIERELNKIK